MRLFATIPKSSAVVAIVVTLLVAGCGPRKKLVQWGWDEPDTAFLRAHVREMEKAPFDGCVFSVRYGSSSRGRSFTWEFWSGRRFERHDLAEALADLRAIRLGRFRESFMRVNVTPGNLDWFDDFSPLVANARLAGELARVAGARGILLDVEQYEGQLFEYRRQKLSGDRSWDEYAKRVRTRGRELMMAFQEGDPGLTVFLTFGYTLPRALSEHGRHALADTPYGLLAPFLDGLLEAAHGRTRIVDGYELSYGFRNQEQFDHGRRLFDSGVLPIVADSRRYKSRMRLGFGLWLDYDWRRQGWSPREPQKNYFSPDGLASALEAALRTSDEYVWIYGETPRWWAPQPDARVPDVYADAVRRARAAVGR